MGVWVETVLAGNTGFQEKRGGAYPRYQAVVVATVQGLDTLGFPEQPWQLGPYGISPQKARHGTEQTPSILFSLFFSSLLS